MVAYGVNARLRPDTSYRVLVQSITYMLLIREPPFRSNTMFSGKLSGLPETSLVMTEALPSLSTRTIRLLPPSQT